MLQGGARLAAQPLLVLHGHQVDPAVPRHRVRQGEAAIDAMRQRFQPSMTQQQYARFAAGLIDGSLDNWRTGAYDCYQRCCLGIL